MKTARVRWSSSVVIAALFACGVVPKADAWEITITKQCPPTNVPPGGILVFTGTLLNVGGTVTNVTVLNDQPIPGTLVTNIPVMTDGEEVTFTGSYVVPANYTGCTIKDTLSVRAVGVNGEVVADTNSAVCPIRQRLSITCPPDLRVQCVSNVPPCAQGLAGFLAAGGEVSTTNVTYSCASGPLVGGPCGGKITRTHTVTDWCGNSNSCVQTITVDDTIPPFLVCPTHITVQCTDAVPPCPGSLAGFFALGGLASDNCDTNLQYFCNDSSLIGGPCGGTIFRTHTVVDDCTNSASCIQLITVRDTIPPIIACQPDRVLECVTGAVPVFGSPTASDNCDTNLTITFVDSQLPATCPAVRIFRRTWTATDDCTNTASCSQTITFVDTTPPIIACQPDRTFEWVTGSVPVFGNPTATDTCDTNVTITFVDSELPANCPAVRIFRRTWTATDDCTNRASCSQTITFIDTTPPVIICPPDQTNQCVAGAVPVFGNPIASDTCDTNVTVTFVDTQLPATCPAVQVYRRTWTATDDCTNRASCSQTITFVDTTAPTFTLCPTNVNLGCNPAFIPGCNLTAVAAVDNCGPVVLTCSSMDVTNGCFHIRTNTYTATDICTNRATCQQIVTWKADTTPPVIMLTPANPQTNFQCFADYLAAPPIVASAFDDCDGTNVTMTAISSISGPVCPILITICWTAIDQCSNSSTRCVFITIRDTIPPVIRCPANILVGCDTNIPPCATSLAGFLAMGGFASDNCDTNLQYYCFDGPLIGNQIVRTHTVCDDCTNCASCTQIITITATNSSVVLYCPPDHTVECLGEVPPAFPNLAQFLAAGGWVSTTNLLSYTWTSGLLIGDHCNGVITRTYTVTDYCSNTVSCQQRIIVRDTTPPNLTCGRDKEVQCGTDWAFDLPTAADNCDGSNVPVVQVSTVTNLAAPRCPRIFSVTRTWSATDTCSNTAYCNQTVTIVDTEPPNITCEQDKEVQCGTDWFFDVPTAVDKCGGFVLGLDPSQEPGGSGGTGAGSGTVTLSGNTLTISISFSGLSANSTAAHIHGPAGRGTNAAVLYPLTLIPVGTTAGVISQVVTLVDGTGGFTIAQQLQQFRSGLWYINIHTTAHPGGEIRGQLDPNVVIEVVSTVTNAPPVRCPRIFSVTRTWRATDPCANSAFCNQTVTIVDTEPPNITCKQDKEVQCGTDWAFDIPTAVDQCDLNNVLIEVVSTVTNAAIPRCPRIFSVTRTWRASDTCGNAAFCNQTVTIVDTEPPNITCEQDKEVQCGTDWAFDIPTAVDKCDLNNVLIEVVATVTNVPPVRCPRVFSVTRTWRASDTCGNAAFCNQTVTIVDTEPPNITCEQDKEVQCGTDWAFDIPTAVDKCDRNNVIIEVVSTVTNVPPVRCPRIFSVTRTWRASDTCGNSAFCNQTVTIVDTEPPHITCGQDKEAQCGTDWAFDIPTAVDKCDLNNVLIEVVATVTNGATPRCPRLSSITRIWRASDTCGNSAFCNQTVTIVDTEPPSITCGQDKEVQCGTDWAFDIPTAVDQCDLNNVLIEVVSTVTNAAIPRCPRIFSVTRTWRASDTCGNAAFCNQTVTIVDTEPPNITCGADKEVQCGLDWAFDIPTATDKCDLNNVLVAVVSTVTNAASPRCPRMFSVTRTWRASDTCGNAAFCNQTVTVVDTTPPNLTCVDDQIAIVECGQPFAFTAPYAVDGCDGTNVAISIVSTTTNVASPQCPNLFTVKRTWRAADTCGNETFCSQTITIMDTTPPNLTCADDQIVECGNPFAFTPPYAVDGCDGTNVTVLISSTTTNAANPRCPELFTVKRTWLARDTCGNESRCSQTITIVDTTPPNLTCADDQIVQCGNPFAFTPPTAYDVCDGTNVIVQITSTTTNAAVPRCPGLFTVRRTWRAIDTCTNETFCSQTITIVDTEPPNLTCADDQIVQCGNPFAFTPPTAYDVCDGTNVIIQITSTTTNAAVPRCPGLFTVRRTWRAIDTCTNETFCSQTITIVDTTPPNITCADDLIVECDGKWLFTPPTAVDVCDGTNVSVTIVSTVTNVLTGEFPKLYTATRTWLATDSCGNATFCSQKVTVADTTPPNIACADDLIVECGTHWVFLAPAAADVCDGTNVIVTVTSTVTNALAGQCPELWTATRTWRAVDRFGNASLCSQRVTVVDTSPPNLSCAADRFVECGMPWAFAPPAAVDVCDGTNIILRIASTVTNLGPCGRLLTATRIWEALDSCANRSTCSQTITVVDTTPPDLVCARDEVVECGSPWNFTPPAANDRCDGTNVAVRIVSTVTNLTCGRTFNATRMWEAIDSCANRSLCSQTIIVVDTTPPNLTCADSMTFDCGTPWNFIPPFASDLCDSNVTVVVSSTTTNLGTCPGTYTATRLWYATDQCGNRSVCSQTIRVVDREAPSLSCAPNRVLECGTPWTFTPPYAFDLCGGTNVTVVVLSTATNSLCGVTYTATRTWLAADACGNAAMCSQTVRIVDTLAPTLSCAPNRTMDCDVPFSFTPPMAFDQCDGTNVTVVVVNTVTNRLLCPFSATRTWQATDRCGNSSLCSQTVTVVDATPPNITCAPNKTVECGQAWIFDAATASDNCGSPILSVFSTVTNRIGRCGNTFDATRTWQAMDACSNSAFCSQTVTVVDRTPPVFTRCPTNMDLGCNPTNIPACNAADVAATDLCGTPAVTCTSVDGSAAGCARYRTNVYTATDQCANTATCRQVFRWTVDTTPPSITCASNKTVECAQAWDFDMPGASDACGGVTITSVSTVTNAGPNSTFLATRTWTGTDVCGNTALCSQTVTINPCPPLAGCRVTGGSNHETNSYQAPCLTTALPTHISHGGQVGAPFSVGTPFTPNSPCISGEWQHNRHLKGNSLVGSFHASGNGHESQFDSLLCACLPCDEKPNSVGVVGELCNPRDRICGPHPPRAPANKICFSGVGDYTFTAGKKTVKAVFRVDIEDRSEGNSASSTRPPDRYRIRLWLLDSSCGRNPDPNSAEALALRLAASADPATIAMLATTENLKVDVAPDIDDGGEMTQGNHQIHKATGATCAAIVPPPAPRINVAAEVATLPPGETFGLVAYGYQVEQDPAFAYRITITNSGSASLTNLSVFETRDTNWSDVSGQYFVPGTMLPPGGAVTLYRADVLGQDTIHTIVVSGQSQQDGTLVQAAGTAVASVEAQLRLSIRKIGNRLILEWPAATPSGFVLERTTSLNSPATWSVISTNTTSPFVVTNPPAGGALFYRMRTR